MLRRASAIVVIASLISGFSASLASAGQDNVLGAIRAQDRVIHANPTYQSLKNFKIVTVAQARAAIPKFRALSTLADSAAAAVSRASATRGQRAGQADWVLGVHDVARGVNDLATALQDLVDHHRAAATTESARADKLVASGNAIGTRGDKLLHLPTSD